MNYIVHLALLLIAGNIWAMNNAIQVKPASEILWSGLSSMKISSLSFQLPKGTTEAQKKRLDLRYEMILLAIKKAEYKDHVTRDYLGAVLRTAWLPQVVQKHIFEYAYENKLEDSCLTDFTLLQLLEVIVFKEHEIFSKRKFMINNPHLVHGYTGFLGSPVGRYPENSYYGTVVRMLISIPREECIKLNLDELRLLEKIIQSSLDVNYSGSVKYYEEANAAGKDFYWYSKHKIQESDISLIKKLTSMRCVVETVEAIGVNEEVVSTEKITRLKNDTQLVENISSFLKVDIEYNSSPVQDSCLIAVPLIMNSVLPDLIGSLCNKIVDPSAPEVSLLVLSGVLGATTCGSFLGSFLISKIMFPVFDGLTSGPVQLRRFFGKNVSVKHWIIAHLFTNALHIALRTVGNAFLGSHYQALRLFCGGAVHLLRVGMVAFQCYVMNSAYCNDPISRGARYKDSAQDKRENGCYRYLLSDVVTG